MALAALALLQAATVPKMKDCLPGAADSVLKEFEGFYRFPNRVAYIRFEVVGEVLKARQTWDGRQYAMVQTGDLTFESTAEKYQVVFDKRLPTTVNILERVTLCKVDFDPTKRIALPMPVAKRYVGRYHLQREPANTIEVTLEDGILVLVQEWDGKRIPLEAITEQEFVNQQAAMPVTFADGGKEGVEMRCFEADIWLKEKQ